MIHFGYWERAPTKKCIIRLGQPGSMYLTPVSSIGKPVRLDFQISAGILTRPYLPDFPRSKLWIISYIFYMTYILHSIGPCLFGR